MDLFSTSIGRSGVVLRLYKEHEVQPAEMSRYLSPVSYCQRHQVLTYRSSKSYNTCSVSEDNHRFVTHLFHPCRPCLHKCIGPIL